MLCALTEVLMTQSKAVRWWLSDVLSVGLAKRTQTCQRGEVVICADACPHASATTLTVSDCCFCSSLSIYRLTDLLLNAGILAVLRCTLSMYHVGGGAQEESEREGDGCR